THGGTLLLHPGSHPAAVKPTHAGTDATASTVSFGSDLAIAINGATVDTQYDQLSVAGTVDLTGVNVYLSGGDVPQFGNIFTIVSATNRIGMLANYAEGDIFTINGAHVRLNYTPTGITLTTLTNIYVDNTGDLVIDVGNGRADDITIVRSGSNYVISDPSAANKFYATVPGTT